MSERRRNLLTRLGTVAAPLAAGGRGFRTGMPSMRSWYRELRKPSWAPPGWVFGPVWTLLYMMMGVAMALVLRIGWRDPRVRRATGLFAGQLGLNALWTPIFFGLRAPGLALLELIGLWTMVAATLLRFYRLRPLAGLLLVPYLIWTTFAGALNAAIWWMNRGR